MINNSIWRVILLIGLIILMFTSCKKKSEIVDESLIKNEPIVEVEMIEESLDVSLGEESLKEDITIIEENNGNEEHEIGLNKINLNAFDENYTIIDSFDNFIDPNMFIHGRFEELGAIDSMVYFHQTGYKAKKGINHDILLIDHSTFSKSDTITIECKSEEELTSIYIKKNPIYNQQLVYVLSNERVRLYNSKFDLIDELILPEIITELYKRNIDYSDEEEFYGYDISSDLEQIIYCDEIGLHQYSIKENSEEFVQGILESNDKKYSDFNVLIHPKYVGKSDNIMADIQGYEWSNGIVYYNQAKMEIEIYHYSHNMRTDFHFNGDPYYIASDYYVEEDNDNRSAAPFMLNLETGIKTEIPALLQKFDFRTPFDRDIGDYQFYSDGFYGKSNMFGRIRYIDLLRNSSQSYVEEGLSVEWFGDFYDDNGDLQALGRLYGNGYESEIIVWNVSHYNKKLKLMDHEPVVYQEKAWSFDDYNEGMLDETTEYLGKFTIKTSLDEGFISDMVIVEEKAYVIIRNDINYLLASFNMYTPENSFKIIIDEVDSFAWVKMSLTLMKDGNISFNCVDEIRIIDTNIDQVISKTKIFDSYEIVSSSDYNNYTFIKNDYKVIQKKDDEEIELFKGFSNADAGESGFHILVPTRLDYSFNGDFISFYTSEYEASTGPYIYNKEGKQIFNPKSVLSGDYSFGEWISAGAFVISQPVYDEPYTKIIDLDDEVLYQLPINGSDRIIISETTHKFALTARNNGVRELVIPYYIYDSKDYSNYCIVNLFSGSISPYSDTVNEMYITDDEIIVVNFEDGDLIIRRYNYVPEYITEKPGEKKLELVSGYTQINEQLYGVSTQANSIELFYLEHLNNTFVSIGKYTKNEILKQIPIGKLEYFGNISNLNNTINIDNESGKILEYNWLVEAVGSKDFDIIAADFSNENIGYMTAYQDNEKVQVQVFYKNIRETEFKEIDGFHVDKNLYETMEFYMLVNNDGKVYYDFYSSEENSHLVKLYDQEEVSVYVENGKNPVEMNDPFEDIQYFDTNSQTYRMKNKNIDLYDGYKSPIYYINNCYIRLDEMENGTNQVILYDYEISMLLATVNIGTDIIIDTSFIGEEVRLSLLHWKDDGGFEMKNLDVLLKQ